MFRLLALGDSYPKKEMRTLDLKLKLVFPVSLLSNFEIRIQPVFETIT